MDLENTMRQALLLAEQSGDEVPVGAVLVSTSGEVLASAHNLRETKSDPTSHAEIEVIRKAASDLADWRTLRCL
jgi:tRNA(adenine34) deaminase